MCGNTEACAKKLTKIIANNIDNGGLVSELMWVLQIIITKRWMYELPHKLLNNLRLETLGNLKNSRKSLKNLELIQVSSQSAKSQISTVELKKCEKSAIKHPKETAILLDFVNLSTKICPWFYTFLDTLSFFFGHTFHFLWTHSLWTHFPLLVFM